MSLLLVGYLSPEGERKVHPTHKRMFESYKPDKIYAGKNWVPFKKGYESLVSDLFINIDYAGNKDKNYDVIILESPPSLHGVKKIKNNYPSASIVYLNSNWMLWPELSHDFYEDYNSLVNTGLTFERKLNKTRLVKNLKKYVDYVISVSEFCDNKIHKLCDIESFVAEPHIEEERYNKLSGISPKLTSKRVVFIGENRDHKGVNNMIKFWREVQKELDDARLRVIGKGHKKRPDAKNVDVLGYISEDELIKELEKACLYLHPALFENFGVSVIEAMRAGVPAIVSSRTGSKKLVKEVDDSLVTELQNIKRRTVRYLETDKETLRKYSRKAKDVSKGYTVDKSQTEIELAINSIQEDVN